MTGPRPTQESLWSGNSFPEVAPQWGNPCSSVCEETEGPSRGALLTRHPQRADGKGRQGVQTPTLRNRVRVQKWAHPCARDKHSPLTCTPGTAAKCHRISQASSVRGVGPATPPPRPVLGQPGEAAVVSAWTSGPQSPQTRRPELSVSSLRTIFYTHWY